MAAALLPSLSRQTLAAAAGNGTAANPHFSRVRPGDPAWPSKTSWEQLKSDVGGRLIEVQSPLHACRDDAIGIACDDVFTGWRNPYWIADQVGVTQTSGWLDAWTSQPSVYAVAAETNSDVTAAVNFAREHNLRLVVKGVGHSFLGTSSALDSLLIWTELPQYFGFVFTMIRASPDAAFRRLIGRFLAFYADNLLNPH